jgi:hypothetical protein
MMRGGSNGLRAHFTRVTISTCRLRGEVSMIIARFDRGRVNSPRHAPSGCFGHWPAGGQIMSITFVVEQTDSARTRPPATITRAIIASPLFGSRSPPFSTRRSPNRERARPSSQFGICVSAPTSSHLGGVGLHLIARHPFTISRAGVGSRPILERMTDGRRYTKGSSHLGLRNRFMLDLRRCRRQPRA